MRSEGKKIFKNYFALKKEKRRIIPFLKWKQNF